MGTQTLTLNHLVGHPEKHSLMSTFLCDCVIVQGIPSKWAVSRL